MNKSLIKSPYLMATLLALSALLLLDSAVLWAFDRNNELRGPRIAGPNSLHMNQVTIATDRGSLTVQIGTIVNITDQYLGDMGFRNLLQYLTHDLTSLTIRNAGITKEGIDSLLRWDPRRHIKNLVTLDLGCNNIGQEGAQLLTKRLRLHLANITSLNLENNNIGNDVADSLLHKSMMPYNLKTINLRGNPLNSISLKQLTERFNGLNGRPLFVPF